MFSIAYFGGMWFSTTYKHLYFASTHKLFQVCEFVSDVSKKTQSPKGRACTRVLPKIQIQFIQKQNIYQLECEQFVPKSAMATKDREGRLKGNLGGLGACHRKF